MARMAWSAMAAAVWGVALAATIGPTAAAAHRCEFEAYFSDSLGAAEQILASRQAELPDGVRGDLRQAVRDGSEWAMWERGWARVDDVHTALVSGSFHGVGARTGWRACIAAAHETGSPTVQLELTLAQHTYGTHGLAYYHPAVPVAARLRMKGVGSQQGPAAGVYSRYYSGGGDGAAKDVAVFRGFSTEPLGVAHAARAPAVGAVVPRRRSSEGWVGAAAAAAARVYPAIRECGLVLELELEVEAERGGETHKRLAPLVGLLIESVAAGGDEGDEGSSAAAAPATTAAAATSDGIPASERDEEEERRRTAERRAKLRQRLALSWEYVAVSQSIAAGALTIATLILNTTDPPSGKRRGGGGGSGDPSSAKIFPVLMIVCDFDVCMYILTGQSLLEGLLRSLIAVTLCFLGWNLNQNDRFTPAYLSILAGFVMWQGNPKG